MINRYLNFVKEQLVFFATTITFSYLLVFRATEGTILEYALFATVFGYTYFLQIKNMARQNFKTKILEAKINYLYNIHKNNYVKFNRYNSSQVTINELEKKLNSLS